MAKKNKSRPTRKQQEQNAAPINITQSVNLGDTWDSTAFSKLLAIQADSLKELQGVKQVLELSQKLQQDIKDAATNPAAPAPNPAPAPSLDPQRIQVEILGQLKEQIKQSRKYYKTQAEFEQEWRKEAADIAQMSKNMKVFKTLGEKLQDKTAGVKEKFSLENLKTGMLKSLNIGGVFDKKLAKDQFIKQQQALGSGATRKQLGEDFEEHNKALKESNKTEAQISKIKKEAEAGGKPVSDEYLASKNKDFADLLEKRREHADKLSTYNRAYDVAAPGGEHVARLDDKGQTGSLAKMIPTNVAPNVQKSSTQTAAEQTQNLEDKEEGRKENEKTVKLLEQIEHNTNPDGTKKLDKVKTPAGTEKEGGGLLSGLLGGGGGKMGNVLKSMKDFGIGIAFVAGGLWLASKAFKSFADVAWEDVGKGLVALGGLLITAKVLDSQKGSIIKGALTLGVLALSLWGISAAFKEFTDLDWETIGKGFLTIIGLGAVGVVLGAFAPEALLGAAALGALGAAVWVVGKGFQAMGDAFTGFTDTIERLSKIDGMNLLKVAAGIAALGPAMAIFAVGNVAGGLSNFVTGLLSTISGQKSPVDQLIEIGKSGEGIEKAATGMRNFGEAMKGFKDIKSDDLKAINDFPWVRATAFVAAGGAMSVNGNKVYNASKGNADEKATVQSETKASQTNVVNAPVTNNTTHNQIIPSPIRNQENSQNRYLQSRYAYA